MPSANGAAKVFGTCFLLNEGGAIGLGTKELVLITASHLVGPGRAALKPAQTLARFEAVSPPAVINLTEELWRSPPTDLNAAIFRVSSVPHGVEPLPVAPSLPSLDSPRRIYVIGHALGGELNISIADNELIDHDGPPDGTPRGPGVVRVHYRAATEPGNSGESGVQ